jgi:hypothetical protein
MNMIGAGWILSAIWFIVEWPRPYSKGMWRKQWGWWFIVFLSVWLWACDEPRTITETEYVDRDVIATEPYYTRTVYDENMGEFTAEQQDELRTKGYITMRLFYSPKNSGQVWVPAGTTSFSTSQIWDICFVDDIYVAVGRDGKIGYSADGDTWAQASTPSFGTSIISGITYGNKLFVAVSADGKIGYSGDINTWIQASTPSFSTTIISKAAYGGGLYVAVGYDGKIGYAASDTIIKTGTLATDSAVVTSIATTTNLFVGQPVSGSGVPDDTTIVSIDSSSQITLSNVATADGATTLTFCVGPATWTQAGTPSFLGSDIFDVCYGDSKFVAVGDNGKIAYSADGNVWTQASAPSFGTTPIQGVDYIGGKFVAVGWSGKIAYSADGDTWTQASTPSFGTSIIYGVGFGNNTFVAVGFGGKIAYSIDANTWNQSQNTSTVIGLNSVVYGIGKFVAVGGSGTIVFSID